MIHAVIYISKADPGFSKGEVKEMLLKAKSYNRTHEITGCILYHKQQFLQLIEGAEKDVRELYRKLVEDNRHHEVTTLFDESSGTRIFPNWAMAFYEFEEEEDSTAHTRLQLDQILEQATISEGNKEAFGVLERSAERLLAQGQHELFNTVRRLFGD
ncbi:BLUF domain-containing protein [Zeaxanthinibacter enoshimensis]|uniref:FAD-dependent sensor of blue light n=1 Tax=Zeaxanthinibacter enoshimensis TaxID=392009 RepID=A0A4R6TPW6_9FLAO|nr:BLUF domain-containing protein [Zeaxanthinibacter enoshimensis]TDQ33355.1 FAD-dependent sensor of blue light [Zeaxanthinibacter enoshimensis]